MKSVNTVTLLGNVTFDPELKTPGEGMTVCTFGLATNREWRDANGDKQSQAEFHTLVAWGKLAEFCAQYVNKGKPVYVEGHLKTNSWENPQGTKLQKTEVVVDNLVLLGTKQKSADVDASVEEAEGVAA